jgi:hypothetical protein
MLERVMGYKRPLSLQMRLALHTLEWFQDPRVEPGR